MHNYTYLHVLVYRNMNSILNFSFMQYSTQEFYYILDLKSSKSADLHGKSQKLIF